MNIVLRVLHLLVLGATASTGENENNQYSRVPWQAGGMCCVLLMAVHVDRILADQYQYIERFFVFVSTIQYSNNKPYTADFRVSSPVCSQGTNSTVSPPHAGARQRTSTIRILARRCIRSQIDSRGAMQLLHRRRGATEATGDKEDNKGSSFGD